MTQKAALVFGIGFLLVGILGFVPNPVIGADGFFRTDIVHNMAHILFGAVLLFASGAGYGVPAMWLKIAGFAYLLLFLDGLFSPDMLFGFVSANEADTWLHLLLSAALLIFGYMPEERTVARRIQK